MTAYEGWKEDAVVGTIAPYNYDSFRREMGKKDMHFRGGPDPGSFAPDFDLPTVAGGRFHLRDYRGARPVLIEFASITCPMATGAMPGLINLFHDFAGRVEVVSVYIREAHPGENYPHHVDAPQKMEHARDWAKLDKVPWTVAVDTLDGATHQAYGPLPNSACLIDRTGHVAFHALWAGQEALLRGKIAELLKREAAGEESVNLGRRENFVIPLIHGGAEFDHTIARAGNKAKEDFRRELGAPIYVIQKLLSRLRPVINPGNSH